MVARTRGLLGRKYIVGTDATIEAPSVGVYNATVDNYQLIHNAFRNHLERIGQQLRRRRHKKAAKEFARWSRILALHVRVEEELFMPALEGRGAVIPAFIDAGHHALEAAISAAAGELTLETYKNVHDALFTHLAEEEATVWPLMTVTFSESELWALDWLIINPALGYCDAKGLQEITVWWFAHVAPREALLLASNFVRAAKGGKLDAENWRRLVAPITALSDFDLQTIAGPKLLADGKAGDAKPVAAPASALRCSSPSARRSGEVAAAAA